MRRYPVVVPPTWNKTDYHAALSDVWKAAADALRTAENVYIIGYSLPPTDQFFHLLWALGSESDAIIRRIVVINPDKQAAERVENQLGPHAIENFCYYNYTFADASSTYRTELFGV